MNDQQRIEREREGYRAVTWLQTIFGAMLGAALIYKIAAIIYGAE